MRKKGTILYILLCVLLGVAVTARAEKLETVLKELARKYSTVKSLSAEFFQESEHPAIKKKTLAQGRVFFKSPNRFRWLILSPPGEEVISDGKTLWIYQPDLSQVIKSTAQRGIPAMVVRLIGALRNIKKEFSVQYQGKTNGTIALRLSPKQQLPEIEKLILFVDSKEFFVVKIELKDSFGRTTSISFRNVVLNPVLDESLFQYTPPPGVTVVEP